ncbi:hypothetical protein EJ07DRAFT_140339 [Lizonia empirigonia]|nr:hypothetical protein EJ07DRAFT_140339 [Lizonia empirigonia]
MPFNYGKVSSEGSDDEAQTHPGPGRVTFWTRVCGLGRHLRWPATFLLLLTILAAEVQVLHRQPASLEIGDEINGIKKFLPDERYSSDHVTTSSLNETKQHWLALLPKGGGFLHIPTHASHTLPPPIHIPSLPGKDVFAIAVFHQMHCLYHMTAYIDTLVLQMRAGNMTIDEQKLSHNDHCFNYLRNAIMCTADTTLEGQALTHGERETPGTDGTGAVHVCRDYDGVFTWAERNRLYDVAHL